MNILKYSIKIRFLSYLKVKKYEFFKTINYYRMIYDLRGNKYWLE